MHPFTIHKRFKHATADITDKGNEKALIDLQIQPVSNLAKDRAFCNSTESSDNCKMYKIMNRIRTMSNVRNA